MAQFLNQDTPRPKSDGSTRDGFDAMGKIVPQARRQAAYEHCKDMGLTNNELAWSCVGEMADKIERDEPYAAMESGMKYLDLCGTYRVMAVLCTAPA